MLMCLTLATLYLLCLHNVESFPTVHKRRYVLLTSDKSNWNDINRHCKDKYNGNILIMYNQTVVEVINIYKNLNPWQNNWGDDIWLGMYMTDHSKKDYTWLGKCSAMSPTFFKWECGNNCDPTLEQEKLCVKAKKDSLEWDFEKCDSEYNGICEEITSECDFEQYTSPGCIQHSSNIVYWPVMSKEDCQNLCRTEVSDGKECWATSYDGSAMECTLSYHSNPFAFDYNKSPFQSCSPAVHVVSWKRCFEPAAKDSKAIRAHSYSYPKQPQMTCSNSPVPTTQPTTTLVKTTTTQPPTTTPAETTTILPKTTAVSSNPTSLAETAQPSTTTLAETTPTTHTSQTQSETTAVSSDPTTLAEATQPITSTLVGPTLLSQIQTGTANQLITTTASIQNPTTTSFTLKSTSADSSNLSVITAIAETPTTANLGCPCPCYNNLSIYLIEATIDRLKRELLVNKKGTSLYRRSLTSATDNRPSAVGLGMSLGVAVIVLVVFSLIIGDAMKVIKWIVETDKKKQTGASNT